MRTPGRSLGLVVSCSGHPTRLQTSKWRVSFPLFPPPLSRGRAGGQGSAQKGHDSPTVVFHFPHEQQEFVNFVAGEVEADIWERVAAEMGGSGLVRGFVSDIGRIVDGRQVCRACGLAAHVQAPEPARMRWSL